MKFSQGSVAGTSLVPHVDITIAMLSLELKLLLWYVWQTFLVCAGWSAGFFAETKESYSDCKWWEFLHFSVQTKGSVVMLVIGTLTFW